MDDWKFDRVISLLFGKLLVGAVYIGMTILGSIAISHAITAAMQPLIDAINRLPH